MTPAPRPAIERNVPRLRSKDAPPAKGPRSLHRATTQRPPWQNWTLVPKASDRWAKVRPSGLKCSPLAVPEPESYHVARAVAPAAGEAGGTAAGAGRAGRAAELELVVTGGA